MTPRPVATHDDWLVIARRAGETMRETEQLIEESDTLLARIEQVLVESASVDDSVLKYLGPKKA